MNHLDDGEIIIHTQLSAKAARTVDQVVAFQADDLDPARRLGWSVVVTGTAQLISDPERVARYQQQLRPGVDIVMDMIIGIRPWFVNGFRLVKGQVTPPTSASESLRGPGR